MRIIILGKLDRQVARHLHGLAQLAARRRLPLTWQCLYVLRCVLPAAVSLLGRWPCRFDRLVIVTGALIGDIATILGHRRRSGYQTEGNDHTKTRKLRRHGVDSV